MFTLTQPPTGFTTTSFQNSTSVNWMGEELLPSWVDILMKILYVVVGSLGLLGNSLVFFLFISKRVRLSAFNVLLLNLSISDAIACLSIWPYVFIDLKSLRNFSADTANSMCVLVMGQMSYWVATVASLFTLTVISVSRYIFIRHPMKSQYFNKKHASYIVILLVWPAAIAICMPNFFSFHYNKQYSICERRWSRGVNGRIYSGVTAALGYILPIVVLVYTFIGTRQNLWLTKTNDIIRSVSSIRRRKAASMLLAALILAFFVCWSPFFVYWIMSRTATSIFPEGPEGDYVRMRFIVFVVFISLFNTVADPIIYALRGDGFQKSVRELLHSVLCTSHPLRQRAETRSSEYPESRSDDHRIHLNRL